MPLSDLNRKAASPGAVLGASDPLGLVRPAEARLEVAPRMSLPAALNAVDRGEIDVRVVADDELPRRPAAVERQTDWSGLEEATREAAIDAAVDHAEMRNRIAAKRGISLEAAEQWMMEQANG